MSVVIAKSVEVDFDGYWREENKVGIPRESCVYCVYRCVYNSARKTVSLRELLYVGEARYINHGISTNEKLEHWKSYLEPGEELCYSCALTDPDTRVRCAAAMIYKHKPPANRMFVESFPFDCTEVRLSGATALLHTVFCV